MTEETGQAILAELKKLTLLLTPDVREIPDRPMTTQEFAVIVDKSPDTVLRWIESGELVAKTDVKPFLIMPANARRFLNRGGHDR